MNVSTKLGQDGDRFSLAGALRDCLACGVIVVDGKQIVRAFTPGAERLTGLQSAEVLNRDTKSLPAALRRVLSRVSKSGKPLEDQPVSLDSASGGKITIRVTAVPLPGGKAAFGVALVLNDASAAQRFEENIRRLDRLSSIGTLSAGMAHEIKNALVAVKTFIDLLLEKNQDAELADVVRREMRRINSLVSQTLKFGGPPRPTLSAISLHDLLEHSLRMVQPEMDKKIIALHRAFNATPDIIHGDDYQLEQVFVNVLLNAVEAMGASGSLTIVTEIVPASPQNLATKEAAPHITVTIADTGMGITAENLGRLFEPFFTTKENGTGLGLAIARRIVEEHRGGIRAQSEVNKGTTFSILLPAHDTAS